ncbi:MAG TPA: hypothetical protein VGA40_05435 [Candidatus Acidoferrales bacterium]
MHSPVRAVVAALLSVALLGPVVTLAERTRFWRQSSYAEFNRGTAKGVALRSDGRLMLAPRFAPFSDPNLAFLWDVRVDAAGTVYAAGGSNATVLRFNDKGEATKVFQSSELAAHALAFDARGNLYVGTAPDGKVYRVTPSGEQSVFFEPKSKYIWALAFAADGRLMVATGDKGEIFAVTPDGKGETYYTSDQTHIRALAFDAKGNLLFGTDPDGLVVRLEETSSGVRAFVLYETAKKEVTSLVVREGSIYVASMGDQPRVAPRIPGAPTTVTAPPVTVTPPPQQQQPGVATVPPPQQQPTTFVTFPSMAGGSEVYRIAPDGSPQTLWTSRDELVYSLGFSPSGKLLLGTGNRGAINRLESSNVFSALANTSSGQVTAIAAGPGGKLYIGTANPGKVFTLGPDEEPEGTFESQTFDAKNFSQWGRLTWWGEDGATNGRIAFYVRSGNTSNPEKNWSPWAGPFTGDGATVSIPAARFAQWKAVFKARSNPQPANNDSAPSIAWVSLAYLPNNVAPVIDDIILQTPNVRVLGFQGSPQAQQQQPVQLRLPTIPGARQQQQPGQRFSPPPQGFNQKGAQAVLWSAKDNNEDDLTYSIYFRGEGEQNWRLLKDKLDQNYYWWDTTTMPDGAYYLKIVASDAPSNPAGSALSAELVSDRFEVDNTPPAVEDLAAEVVRFDAAAGRATVRLRFEVRDSYSAIARAEYSLDAGDWMIVFPADRTSDSPHEKYEVTLEGVTPGERTIVVRAFDQFDNTSSAKVTLSVTAPQRR